MSSAHIIYIPLVAMGGILIGFVLGARAARNAMVLENERDRQREQARTRREARKAARQSAPTDED